MQPRLKSLIERHRRIDREVALAMSRPGTQSLAIQRLKRIRLALKDHIAAITVRAGRQPA